MPRHPPSALTHSPPIRVSSMCARNVSNTLVSDDKKITLHKQHFRVVDARVHYTILKPLPNTTHHTTKTLSSMMTGLVPLVETTPTPCRGFVIPGPNNVSVQARPNTHRRRGTNPNNAERTSEMFVMFHP